MSALDVVKKGVNAVNAGDFATLESLTANDFIMEGPMPQPVDKAGYLAMLRALKTAFPDWNFNVTGWAEEGNLVHATNAITGTHTGTLNLPMLPGPIAPTGKKIKLPPEPTDFTVANGKVTHIMVHSGAEGGLGGILKQIGVSMPGM